MKNTFSSPAKFFRGFTTLLAFSLTLLFSCERDKIILDIEAPAENLTFQKITKPFASGGKFTTANILANVQGKKTGYTLKVITDLDPNNLVTVSDKKELNFSGGFGNFTATLILQHRAKKDATITNCEFEITRAPAENLTFQKVTKLFVSGGKFTTTDILNGVQGSKTDYTIKEINTLNPSNLATVTATKELNFSGSIGSFTATIILKHPYKNDVTLNCEFEITSTRVPTWRKTFGGSDSDGGKSIVQTTDGGFALAGWTKSKGVGNDDFWVLKLDSAGNKTWDKTFGESDGDDAKSIIQTTDGGFAVVGYKTTSTKNRDIWVLKLDGSGNKTWDKTFGENGNDSATDIIQTKDGGFVVVGALDKKTGLRADEGWVIKLDSGGNKTWDKTFGTSSFDAFYSIIQTSDGGFALSGYKSEKGVANLWVLKLNKSGDRSWEKTFGGSDSDTATSIIQTSDGGYALAGYTFSKGVGNYDAWVLKLDGSGNRTWDKTFGGASRDIAFDIIQTSDGGFAFTGHTMSKSTGGSDFWVIKLDRAGNKTWEKTYGDVMNNQAHSIIQTSDGGLAVVGWTDTYLNHLDLWVLKLDKNGNL